MQVSPVFAQPPALRCPVGPLWLWYCEPAGTVVQVMEACVFTRAMAEWLVGPIWSAVSAHFPGSTDLRFVLDLRPMTAREAAVRSVFMEAGSNILRSFSHVLIVQPVKPPPLYLVTLKGAAALLSAFGPEVRLVASADAAIAELGLRAQG